MDRLKEKSTWAGLFVMAAQAGKLLLPEWGVIFDALAFVAGSAAVGMREKSAQ